MRSKSWGRVRVQLGPSCLVMMDSTACVASRPIQSSSRTSRRPSLSATSLSNVVRPPNSPTRSGKTTDGCSMRPGGLPRGRFGLRRYGLSQANSVPRRDVPDGPTSWLVEHTGRMGVVRIDHVQLAMPAGREAEAIAFYEGVLGIPHVPKPDHLAARGGCWFERGP
jgi:hypothetical protein